ncbi:MAG: ATP-binding cassette domain-containing protein [Lachnospiraceae bacterium]|nr:ATP-binding cassette domain-containing protein [Lachnospiraceae bacterium]
MHYIEVKNYTKKLKGKEVLKEINVRFEQGHVYGLKGKNGSGKTMLMRAISGLIHSTEGTVEIDGKILGEDMEYPDSMGLLLENPAFLSGETGFQNLRILARLRNKIGEQEIREIIVEVGLEPDDKRKYYKYSLGMKQKLGIAAAIMEKPDIIILDEPINALDSETAEKIKNIIIREKERGAIIILACHNTEELEFLSDTIIEINDGKIL